MNLQSKKKKKEKDLNSGNGNIEKKKGMAVKAVVPKEREKYNTKKKVNK